MTWKAIAAACLVAAAWPTAAQDAASLKSKHGSMQDRLQTNPFGRPLALDSTETAGDLRGDVYSVVEHPYPVVLQALQSVENWCDILMLHLNVKGCKVQTTGQRSITMNLGRKFDQKLEDAYTLEFAFKVPSASAEYLQVQLSADEGPLGTKDYKIVAEAVPLDGRRTFLHMAYAYGYGMAAKMAIKTYLATLGRDKVGFSPANDKGDGAQYVGGVRGLLERNTMRYYLAIDAYLSAHAAPRPEQPERRLKAWYGATNRYARQLREMDEADYLDMKRKELRRQAEAKP